MLFLSNGDFGFPFTWPLYLAKQFFIWSYQSGAANIDGITRMPGRLIDLLVFMAAGNLVFEYFFIASSLAIVFASFFYFARTFLKIKNVYIQLLLSLLFTLNPIVLGNLSKVGLVLAAAMLPACLTVVQEAFEHKRLSYFIWWLIFLNISLIHPFTFAVNLVASGIYFLYQASARRSFDVKSLAKFAGVAGLFVLLNAYFILPLFSIQTIDKGVLSNAATSTPTDYTALVDALNTGDILTGLSLSKNVVKDYDFYNSAYQPAYFLSIFAFYVLLFGLYLWLAKKFDAVDKGRFAVFLTLFLVLLALATVTLLGVDILLKLVINLPGGWAFRSPLKWQLYIPLVLIAMLGLLIKYIKSPGHRLGVCAGLVAMSLLMNGYLFVDIYHRLLTPRSIQYFGALQHLNLDHKNLLLAMGEQCIGFEQRYPEIMTELNQVLDSKNVQVRQININDIGQINMNSFGYILSCENIAESTVAQAPNFALTGTFVDGIFQLYTNKAPQPYVYAMPDIFTLGQQQPAGMYGFVANSLHKKFNFVDSAQKEGQAGTSLQDVFGPLTFGNIRNGFITSSLSPVRPGLQKLYLSASTKALYYDEKDAWLSLAAQKQPGYQLIPANSQKTLDVTVPAGKSLTVSYADQTYTYKNLVPNGSLEKGLWQKSVSDCYNYDNRPSLGMSLDKSQKTDGGQSLKLTAGSHIACTGPADIFVKPGQTYLLSFDYQTSDFSGGYTVNFNNLENDTLSGRLTGDGTNWRTFTKVITIPSDSISLHLQAAAYPDSSSGEDGVARYDNFRMVQIPDIQSKFYLVNESGETVNTPPKVSFNVVDPTRTL
ncbi:MAG TPA: hypothetical protein VNG90_03655, partial [Candidatus Acidoferrum sp.]|nr:hypothetical protein [Candidatus Acidoferrum sp.]